MTTRIQLSSTVPWAIFTRGELFWLQSQPAFPPKWISPGHRERGVLVYLNMNWTAFWTFPSPFHSLQANIGIMDPFHFPHLLSKLWMLLIIWQFRFSITLAQFISSNLAQSFQETVVHIVWLKKNTCRRMFSNKKTYNEKSLILIPFLVLF